MTMLTQGKAMRALTSNSGFTRETVVSSKFFISRKKSSGHFLASITKNTDRNCTSGSTFHTLLLSKKLITRLNKVVYSGHSNRELEYLAA